MSFFGVHIKRMLEVIKESGEQSICCSKNGFNPLKIRCQILLSLLSLGKFPLTPENEQLGLAILNHRQLLLREMQGKFLTDVKI